MFNYRKCDSGSRRTALGRRLKGGVCFPNVRVADPPLLAYATHTGQAQTV